MENDWDIVADALNEITVHSNPNNEPVTVHGYSDDLTCIGVGTDAAVFRSDRAPAYAFKLYAEDKVSKIEIEKEVYNKIGHSPYFATCYGASEKFLVLSYEEGTTLFECLLRGIHVPEQAIQDVENAREYIRNIGLNPRDIHLKNVLLHNGRAIILDVSEYVLSGNDFRWEHLKKAYDEFYHLFDGKAVPYWLLEVIRKWYNHWQKQSSSFDEFMQTTYKHFKFRK